MLRGAIDLLGLAALATTVASCNGPARPPKAASEPVETAAPPPDAGAHTTEGPDARAAASFKLQPLDGKTSTNSSPCAGVTVDLAKALSDESCYVPAPSPPLPRLPDAVKVTLTSTPTELRDGQLALVTLSLRNTGADAKFIYFVPRIDRIRLEIDLLDPRTNERHIDNPVIFPVVTTAVERWARIQLGAFGEAIYQGCWQATRTTGRAVKMSRPNAVPLDPGDYELIFWTAIAGFATSEPERGVSPSTRVRVVAGKRCSSFETPPCACPRPTTSSAANNQVP